MKTTQKTQKNTKFPPPPKKSELGLDPPTPFPSFSRIIGFVLTWQNPLSGTYLFQMEGGER